MTKTVALSAVRFGRVPKREKAKMVEDMHRTTVQSQIDAVAVQYENDSEATERIQHAFQQLVVSVKITQKVSKNEILVGRILTANAWKMSPSVSLLPSWNQGKE